MSPEVLLGDNLSDPNIDLWALGVMMYTMVFGKHPFDGSSREQIKDNIIKNEICFKQQKRLLHMKKAGSMTTNTSTKARVSILKKDDINEADDDDKAAAS